VDGTSGVLRYYYPPDVTPKRLPLQATVAVVMVLVIRAVPATAQQRPLPLESPEGVGAGNVAVSIGLDYTRDTMFTLSGLKGNLWRLALIRFDVGLSNVADFELSGGLRDHLSITSRTAGILSGQLRLSNPTATGAFDDIMVGTKVRLVEATASRPGVAIRVATRLPNAKHPSGLGQDAMDFYGTVAVSNGSPQTRLTGNVGIGVLGDPLQGNRHVNSLLYGASASRQVQRHLVVIAGVDGRTGPLEPGLESRAVARAGLGLTRGSANVELSTTLGLTRRDGNVGFALSAVFALRACPP
jgi:hypothetical protein